MRLIDTDAFNTEIVAIQQGLKTIQLAESDYGIGLGMTEIEDAIVRLQTLITNSPTVQREGWVSVDDRLPSAMQEVLLTNSEGDLAHGKPLFYNTTGAFSCWIFTLYSQDILDNIPEYQPSHWMPLPALPTDKE